MISPRFDVINKILSSKAVLCWNNAVWLAKTSHVTINSQSECFISAQNYIAMLKIIYDIGSSSVSSENYFVPQSVWGLVCHPNLPIWRNDWYFALYIPTNLPTLIPASVSGKVAFSNGRKYVWNFLSFVGRIERKLQIDATLQFRSNRSSSSSSSSYTFCNFFHFPEIR